MAEEYPPSVNNTTRTRNGYLSKSFAEYAPSQQVKIELYRLKFLMDCKSCKRPPPSLRIRGASAIKNSTKIQKFSSWESDLLLEAIKEKQKLVKSLRKRVQVDTPLSPQDDKMINEHFAKKLDFYISQNKTKWKEWPNKRSKKTEANFHRKNKRKMKRLKMMQKRLSNLAVLLVVVS